MTSPDTLPCSSPETFADGFGNHPEPRLQQVGMAGPQHGFRQVSRIRAAEGDGTAPSVCVNDPANDGVLDQYTHVGGGLWTADFRSFWSIYSKQPDPHLPEREGVTVNHAGDADEQFRSPRSGVELRMMERDRIAREKAREEAEWHRRKGERERDTVNALGRYYRSHNHFSAAEVAEHNRIMSACLIRERDDDEQHQQRREQPEDNRPNLLRRWIDRDTILGVAFLLAAAAGGVLTGIVLIRFAAHLLS